MNAKHTPGPWRRYFVPYTGQHQIRDEAEEIVIAVIPTKARHEVANAHLIAAAPDLLAACVEAEDVLLAIYSSNAYKTAANLPQYQRQEWGTAIYETLQLLRAATTKALGGSKA